MTVSERVSRQLKRQWRDPEFRRHQSEVQRGRKRSPEARRNLAAANRRKAQDPAWRATMRAAGKAAWKRGHKARGPLGPCEICGGNQRPTRQLAGDHDHVLGHARGLLCDPCNQQLGKLELGTITSFRKRPQLLYAAMRYLKRHGSWPLRKP